jgi:hypothetical protein
MEKPPEGGFSSVPVKVYPRAKAHKHSGKIYYSLFAVKGFPEVWKWPVIDMVPS